jgi:hypothetical protein
VLPPRPPNEQPESVEVEGVLQVFVDRSQTNPATQSLEVSQSGRHVVPAQRSGEQSFEVPSGLVTV